MDQFPCKICNSATKPIGFKTGEFRKVTFELRRCPNCGLSFVANPWTDYAAIYSEDYYAGRGADPLVDYRFELEHPSETIRFYEWRGIAAAVRSLIDLTPSTSWLDFGCGNGGLVRYCRDQGLQNVFGFEEGAIRAAAEHLGIPYLTADELNRKAGSFDVITAIEVLEHVEDPLPVLRRLRLLLRPNGLFFVTTGNARPYRRDLLQWRYVVPEIHINFYEPCTLGEALLRSGFRPDFRRNVAGFEDIIRFKILKNLGVRRRATWERTLPWPLLCRLADRLHGVTEHPVGWAA